LTYAFHSVNDQFYPCYILYVSVSVGNLSGHCRAQVYDHTLLLSCDRYLPTTAAQIPTGKLQQTQGSLFDFSTERCLRPALEGIGNDDAGRPGLDHCFVVNGALSEQGEYLYDPVEQKALCPPLLHVATLSDPLSGRVLDVMATQPGVQLYSANWLADPSSDTAPHIMHNGLAIETQHFPDAINNPTFPPVLLRPNMPYYHKALFVFSTM
jgi:aldose 1-epimerase